MTQSNINRFASNNADTDKGSYKLVRGDNAPLMIEFQFKTGDSKAFSYPYLTNVGFKLSEGITISFTTGEVIIKGRNLQPLHKYLLLHKVVFIQEIPDDDLPEEDTFISSIILQ